MKKIFVINGGQNFAHSGGAYNKTVATVTEDFFVNNPNFELKVTHIDDGYNPAAEVEKFIWADVVVYHTPVWWFQVPFGLKKYIDEVFTAGHKKGMYNSDGRHAATPLVGYGTGGALHGRQYMITTSWNAPETAFTLPGEFFDEKSVDEGIMFGFHRMNAFTGMEPLPSFHFHDVEKNPQVERDMERYRQHLETIFTDSTVIA